MVGSGQVILVVEDDRAIADTVVYALKTEGFLPEWVADAATALDRLGKGGVTLVLMDLGLPDVVGFDLLRAIRERFPLPVIVVTARDETIDRVTGLELGADDYVTKPFSPREVTARVRAVLRRSQESGAPASVSAPTGGDAKPEDRVSRWHHDVEGCSVSLDGKRLDLTRYEYRLLALFLSRPGRVYSRDHLMERVWEDPGASFDRTVDAHIKTLRQKLRQVAPEIDPIQTHRGMGYSLRPEAT